MRIKTNAYVAAARKANASGLIAEYLFDNVEGNIAPDSSGNGQHLTLYNTEIVDGKIGKCLSIYSGLTSYAEAPSGVIPGEGPFSFSIWVRRDYFVPAATSIFCNKNANSETGVTFYTTASPNVTIGVNAINTSTVLLGELPLGVWRHFAFTHSGVSGDTAYLYTDGVLTRTGALNGTRGEGRFNLLIGKRTSTAWVGYVDNLRFYNKELSQEEVLQLYQEGETT